MLSQAPRVVGRKDMSGTVQRPTLQTWRLVNLSTWRHGAEALPDHHILVAAEVLPYVHVS